MTVKLLLAESRLMKRAIKSFVSHAFDALSWTLLHYTMLWIGFAAFVFVAFLGLYLLREAAKLYNAADTKFAKAKINNSHRSSNDVKCSSCARRSTQLTGPRNDLTELRSPVGRL